MNLAFLLACADPATDTVAAKQDCDLAWYVDADADGFGAGAEFLSCDVPPGSSATGDDCDDLDAGVHPGATETCDGRDEDCDAEIDEGLDLILAARDADGDGFGDPATLVEVCAVGDGWTTDTTDCADDDPAVFPGTEEVCNGVDDDCDGHVDDDDAPVSGTVPWPVDADGDGYGGATALVWACAVGPGRADNVDDCDDTDATISPAAAELCFDSVDQDCDGLSDDYSGACWPEEAHSELDCGEVTPIDNCSAGNAAVGADGTAWPTIQEALDAAVPGDAVTVCPGRWVETLEPRVEGALVGFGPGVSVLAGDGGGTHILDLWATTYALVGLSFEASSGTSGGAVGAASTSLCIDDSAFAWNTADWGGGLGVSGDDLELYNSVFYANDATWGGALVTGECTTRIDGVVFRGGSAGYAGAVWSDGDAEVTNTVFVVNSAVSSVGAASFGTDGGTLTFRSVRFEDNDTGGRGGGLEVRLNDGAFHAEDLTFTQNVAVMGGGALYIDANTSDVQLDSTTFSRNQATLGAGGAIGAYAEDLSITAKSCTFDANASFSSGGAIDLMSSDHSNLTLDGGSVVSNNAAPGGGVAIWSGVVVESIDVDWGTGGTDNTVDDVTGYTFDGVASFVCPDLVCG